MNSNVCDVFEVACRYKTKQERADVLKANDSFAMKSVLQLAFHPNVKAALPEGAPPYKPVPENQYDYHRGYLHAESRKMGYLVDQPGQNLNKIKRENIFITILESLPGPEAQMLIAAKDKKLHKLYKGITADVAKLAFPDILPDDTKE
jgi:Family of unknown function (DUF6433)